MTLHTTGFVLLLPVFLFWLEAPTGYYGHPDISYAILIDAGSTGSRMYIYKYELKKKKKVDIVNDVEELANSLGKLTPGLSSMLKLKGNFGPKQDTYQRNGMTYLFKILPFPLSDF